MYRAELHRPRLLRAAYAACVVVCSLAPVAPTRAQPAGAVEWVVARSAGPLAEAQLRAGLRARRSDFLHCLGPHGDLPGPAGGAATLRIMVASNGAVVVAEVQQATGLEVESCIARVVQMAEFPTRPAFTTFTVRVRLGAAVGEEERAHASAPVAPARAQVGLALTRVRGALRPSAARRGFVAARAAIRACFLTQAARAEVTEMRLRLVVRVDSAGRVRHVGESTGSVSSARFERCLDRALRAVTFPAPDEGTAEIEQSIRLKVLPAGE